MKYANAIYLVQLIYIQFKVDIYNSNSMTKYMFYKYIIEINKLQNITILIINI